MAGGRGIGRYAGAAAIVTGGASGIGRGLGQELLRAGAHVVLADVDGAAAEVTAAELRAATPSSGGSVEGRALDVRDRDAVEALVADVVARHGRIDLLCNNAGISLGGPTHEMTGAHWDRILDVNLKGVVNGVLAAYPRMVEQGHGQIVNTASGAGLAAPPFITAYAATKHAVVGLSTGLRPEAALHGVRINVLCPGSIDTAILDSEPDADLPPGASALVTGRTYLNALRQKPVPVERIAGAAVRQMAADRGLIVVPAQAKALWYVQRISPGLLQRMLRPIARKVQRDLIRPAGAPEEG